MCYCLITPAKDEERFAQRCIESVLRQRKLPRLWLLIDDGSHDRTADVIGAYTERHAFIHLIRRPRGTGRKVGAGVVEAFNIGLREINLCSFEFLCKCDLDLEIPEGYFAGLIEKMAEDPLLGSCSGAPYYVDKTTGGRISEFCGPEAAVGMTKFYRVRCFLDIGGFAPVLGWDGIDAHRCRQFGWKSRCFYDDNLRFEHLRPMGSSDKGLWKGRMRNGRSLYVQGNSLFYMLVVACYRLVQPPYVVGAVGLLVGYIRAWLRREHRFGDQAYGAFVRRYQRLALVIGRTRAAERLRALQAEHRHVERLVGPPFELAKGSILLPVGEGLELSDKGVSVWTREDGHAATMPVEAREEGADCARGPEESAGRRTVRRT